MNQSLPRGSTRRLPLTIGIVFALAYVGFQCVGIAAHGSGVEHWLIEVVNVRSSVALIDWLTPGVGAVADGASIVAPDARINIKNGCEGTELLYPLFAAILAYPFALPTRLFALVAGALCVYVLNQARILALFYAFRQDPGLFGVLHGFVTPLALIAGLLLFFLGVLQWDKRARVSSASSSSAS